MGKKKGKMSDLDDKGLGFGKWAKNQIFRELHHYVHEARKSSYDTKGVERKRNEMLQGIRKPMIFPYLNRLIQDRVRDDVLRATLPQAAYRSITIPLNFEAVTSSFQQKITDYVNNFISPQYPKSKIKKLFTLSVECLAKRFRSYPYEYLQFAFSFLTSADIEYLKYLCMKNQTLSDQNISLFGYAPIEVLYLSDAITPHGLTELVNTMVKAHENHRPVYDSWESIEIDQIHIYDSRLSIHTIYYCHDRCWFETIQIICEHFPQLTHLYVIQTDLQVQDWSIAETESIQMTMQLISYLIEHAPALENIHLVGCSWVTIPAFQTLFRHLQHFQATADNGKKVFALHTISIYGRYEREQELQDAFFFIPPEQTANSTTVYSVKEINTTAWSSAWENMAQLYEEVLHIQLILHTEFTLLEQQCNAEEMLPMV